jgi:hypothetical protein
MATLPEDVQESLRSIKKVIQCTICLDELQNPEMLFCSHVFCSGCITEVCSTHTRQIYVFVIIMDVLGFKIKGPLSYMPSICFPAKASNRGNDFRYGKGHISIVFACSTPRCKPGPIGSCVNQHCSSVFIILSR